MKRVVIFIGIIMLLLTGCASTKTNVGGYQNNLYLNTKILGKNEIVIEVNNGNSKKHYIMPFISKNDYLPKNVVDLRMALAIYNPNPLPLKIVVDSEFIELDTNNILRVTEYIYHSKKTEYVRIPMPLDNIKPNTGIKFAVKVIFNGDNQLFKSNDIHYKIK